MNEDVKRRWTEALRSGAYTQGESRLHAVRHGQHYYCCLGVLCELAVEDGLVGARFAGFDPLMGDYRYGEARMSSVLPVEVAEWAGLSQADPSIEIDGVPVRLSFLNDTGTAFARIADLIEENL